MQIKSNPIIYEINTLLWLRELTLRYGHEINLGNVPESEWRRLGELGFSGVWLMGVWQRSPGSVVIARGHDGLRGDYSRALGDWVEEDVVGSPYAVQSYCVEPRLGGTDGLRVCREAMARFGLALILDFVPNHTALDHEWLLRAPGCYLSLPLTEAGFRRAGPIDGHWLNTGEQLVAHGRDPFFPHWTDTAQLHAMAPAYRAKAIETLASIAQLCDGVRCDMAMLVMNQVFARTWGDLAGPAPVLDFWEEVIPAVRRGSPEFVFIAEAYWDMEWKLLQQGFDYCYDKRLYDRMVHQDADAIRGHLAGEPAYHKRMVRFVENHDEPRAATVFGRRQEAATVAVCTLPGLRLLFHGQLSGRRVKLPVQLGREPDERRDEALARFHELLLPVAADPMLSTGKWSMLSTSGWVDNQSHRELLVWHWEARDGRSLLVVINWSERPSQGRVQLPWMGGPGRSVVSRDLVSGQVYTSGLEEVMTDGLYVALGPWGYHLLSISQQ